MSDTKPTLIEYEQLRAKYNAAVAAVGGFITPAGGNLASAIDLISLRCSMAEKRTLPDEMTPEIKAVLSLMVFQCSPIAHAYRMSGTDIPHRAEEEQAFVLWRLLRLVLEYGGDWQKRFADEIDAIVKAKLGEITK